MMSGYLNSLPCEKVLIDVFSLCMWGKKLNLWEAFYVGP